MESIIEVEASVKYTNTFKTKVSNDENVNATLIATAKLSKIIATVLTNNSIQLYDESFNKIQTIKGQSKTITDLCFSRIHKDLLYFSSLDGTIQLWDLRINGAVKEFKDGSHSRVKALCSFDINCNENYMCAGSEQVITEAFILTWDLRQSKLLGGYWDSHTDDITSVCFHHQQPNTLMTGSSDGLINIFDLNQTTEDDALQNTLNTESSVDKLKWFNECEKIACITYNETLQIWDVEQLELLKEYDRSDFANHLQMKQTPSQLLGLNVNLKMQMPTLMLTSEKNATVLVEVNEQPTAHSVLFDSSKTALTGAFWEMENEFAITVDESAGIYFWKKIN